MEEVAARLPEGRSPDDAPVVRNLHPAEGEGQRRSHFADDAGGTRRPSRRPRGRPEDDPRGLRGSEPHRGLRRVQEAEGFQKWVSKPIGIPTGPLREYALSPEKFAPSKDVKSWPVGFLWIRDEGLLHGLLRIDEVSEREGSAGGVPEDRARPRDPRRGREGRVRAGLCRSELRLIKFRCGVRDALPKGWKALDTENFIIVYHTGRRQTHHIARDLEAIQPCTSTPPPVKKIETVSIVRVCKNREEYRPTADTFERRLLAPRQRGARLLRLRADRAADGPEEGPEAHGQGLFRPVLYHEAFSRSHLLRRRPDRAHDWFNEGHGDYFSGALIRRCGTRVRVDRTVAVAHHAGEAGNGSRRRCRAARRPRAPGSRWTRSRPRRATSTLGPLQDFYSRGMGARVLLCGESCQEAPSGRGRRRTTSTS